MSESAPVAFEAFVRRRPLCMRRYRCGRFYRSLYCEAVARLWISSLGLAGQRVLFSCVIWNVCDSRSGVEGGWLIKLKSIRQYRDRRLKLEDPGELC